MRRLCVLGCAAFVLGAAPAAHAAAAPSAIRTVPAVPGMRFSLDGRHFEADGRGVARPPLRAGGSLRALDTALGPGVRARIDRWFLGRSIAAISLYYKVRPAFVDLSGHRVNPDLITSVVLRGGEGGRRVVEGGGSLWLRGNRAVPESQGRRSVPLSYAVDRVTVAGSTVVQRAEQRFRPSIERAPKLRLAFFAARFTVRDALLGFPIGSAVRLEYPNGQAQRHALGSDAELTLTSLPRGDYRVSVEAPGISSSRPVALSRNQEIDLQVISWLDVTIVLLGLASVGVALFFVRRVATTLSVLLLAGALSLTLVPRATAATPPDPLFAYYYIWFDRSSWDRAKKDYPLLGRYSSDERGVMRRHVRWAKRAGIDGFIVSWKSTPVLDRRLRRLAEVAASEHFKLLMIYQGLDFHRRPLPAGRVARDIDVFARRYAGNEAFDVFGKPVLIWSGTPSFSRAELARVTGPRRRKLLILASERNVEGYRRVAPFFDGDAYYWSSVDPSTYPGYPAKLAQMGGAVHAHGGLWIAPAAPGFDARLVGAHSVVARRDGATLRSELDAAAGSSPDAIGLISWNEFSENTHIEPSRNHGSRYLQVVADVRGAKLPEPGGFDSSEPAATGVNYGVPLLGGIALFLVGVSVMVLRRRADRTVA
jgi:hypothetical protein